MLTPRRLAPVCARARASRGAGAIDTLLDVYKGLFGRPGGGYLCEGAKVDLRRVKALTVEVAALEEQLLRKRRENEQREEGRKAQRRQDVAQRTAERRHLSLLAESAQTPQQLAMGGMGGSALVGAKRPRDASGGPNGFGGGGHGGPGGCSDEQLLRLFNTIKEYADSAASEPLELPSSLSGMERRLAHQYCDELGLLHPTVGSEPHRTIVLSKKDGGGGGGADGRAPSAADFAAKLKGLLRERGEIAEPTDEVELGREGWRERYYEQKLGPDWRAQLPAMCEAYVRGLCWVMGYYYDGCPSWHWFYPFHYAPFATDLVSAIDMEAVSTEFELGTPFRPLEQLMAVLPPGSAHALPAGFAKLMLAEDSPLAHIYPLSFESDLDGKRFAWQAVVLLPFIDQVRRRACRAPRAVARARGISGIRVQGMCACARPGARPGPQAGP